MPVLVKDKTGASGTIVSLTDICIPVIAPSCSVASACVQLLGVSVSAALNAMNAANQESRVKSIAILPKVSSRPLQVKGMSDGERMDEYNERGPAQRHHHHCPYIPQGRRSMTKKRERRRRSTRPFECWTSGSIPPAGCRDVTPALGKIDDS
jgi:hypothetical protein